MSFAGGLAATRAAVTGAGAGLRDRFPTREQQLERTREIRPDLLADGSATGEKFTDPA